MAATEHQPLFRAEIFRLNQPWPKHILDMPMSFTPDTRVPGRPGTRGPEALFISGFLASGALGRNGGAPLIFNEPKLPTGFPDIVAVYLRDTQLTLNPTRNALTHEHLRLLHHLCSVRTSSVERILADIGWRKKMLQRCIAELEDANLLYMRGASVFARRMKSIFAVKKIVAIEAKLDNWWRALHQASSNTWFASHSYVLIPRNRNLDVIKKEASAVGVGVMVFDGLTTEIVLESRVHPLPASYGSWLFNEWAIRKAFSDSPT